MLRFYAPPPKKRAMLTTGVCCGTFVDNDVQLQYVERSTWFSRTFHDWTVPWWTSIVLYAVIAAGWVMCVYTMLLYGSTFTDDQVR